MFVEEVRRPYKDKVYTAVLLRETYRMLAYYIQWHIERDLEDLQERYPDDYGSLRLVFERLQTLQLNTVKIRDQTFGQVTEPRLAGFATVNQGIPWRLNGSASQQGNAYAFRVAS